MKRLAILAAVALTACGKDDGGGAAKAPPPAPDAKPAVPLTWIAIPEVKIQIEMPGAPVPNNVFGNVFQLETPGCTLLVGTAFQGDTYYDEQLQMLEKNLQGATVGEWKTKEQRPDGTFAIEALYRIEDREYWYIDHRVAAGGEMITCKQEGIQSTAHAECVARACRSIKPL